MKRRKFNEGASEGETTQMNKTKQTIVVNGRVFDVNTGRPLAAAAGSRTPVVPSRPVQKKPASIKTLASSKIISDVAPKTTPKPSAATPIKKQKVASTTQTKSPRAAAPHRKAKPQKSTTLRRDLLKKPQPKAKTAPARNRRRVAQSPMVSRFAAHNSTPAQTAQKKTPQRDIDHELEKQQAVIKRAHEEHITKQTVATQKVHPKEVKEQLLQKHLAKAVEPQKPAKKSLSLSSKQRLGGMIVSGFALLFIGGYLTYTNIPNLSIKVASANAGIDAALPRYQPDGFRINGPIAYTNGEVSVKYKQAGSPDVFTLTQRTSDWDPQATLDNYVEPESQDNYEIHSAQGLTVYTYDKKAVWVNGGILHIIEGSVQLSAQQIERIAASM